MGIPVQHLTNLISNYLCNACDANMGRRGYLLKKPSVSDPTLVPIETIVPLTIITPVAITSELIITPGSIPSILDPAQSSLEHDIDYWKSLTTPSDIPTLEYPSYGGFLILPPVAPSLDDKMIILHYPDST
jgi:hypothetical protein